MSRVEEMILMLAFSFTWLLPHLDEVCHTGACDSRVVALFAGALLTRHMNRDVRKRG